MDTRLVPYNQDIYYPVTALNGTYGYVYTGPGPNECNQYHNLIGLDGLNFQSSGMQNEFFPYVYYTPGYDYAQSHYNPHNPYVPGAVIRTDTQFMGAQHMQTVPHFGYTSVVDQSRSDAIQNCHPDALYFNNGVGYSSSLLPMGAPLKVSSDNLSWDLSTKLLPYGDMTGGGSQMLQVNASGHFCGVAEMIGPVDFHRDMEFWLQDEWRGCFPVKWHIIKDVTNLSFRHIILMNNESRPVTSSRDTQEVPYLPGMNMLTIFKNSPLKTCIFDDFSYYEDRQRMMHEENSMISPYLAKGKGEIHVQSTDEIDFESNEDIESTEQMSSHANDDATEDLEDGCDVLTVGSMQINITDANRLISGILTFGSLPDDVKKGSKT